MGSEAREYEGMTNFSKRVDTFKCSLLVKYIILRALYGHNWKKISLSMGMLSSSFFLLPYFPSFTPTNQHFYEWIQYAQVVWVHLLSIVQKVYRMISYSL